MRLVRNPAPHISQEWLLSGARRAQIVTQASQPYVTWNSVGRTSPCCPVVLLFSVPVTERARFRGGAGRRGNSLGDTPHLSPSKVARCAPRKRQECGPLFPGERLFCSFCMDELDDLALACLALRVSGPCTCAYHTLENRFVDLSLAEQT